MNTTLLFKVQKMYLAVKEVEHSRLTCQNEKHKNSKLHASAIFMSGCGFGLCDVTNSMSRHKERKQGRSAVDLNRTNDAHRGVNSKLNTF